MPQLRTIDGQLFDLSEPAARLSVFVQYALDDVADGAPVLVDLGAASLARVAALLERTVVVVEGEPEERRVELRTQGLPRGAALDDELHAAADAALDAALGVVSLLDVAQLLFELRLLDAPLPTTMLAERAARLLRGQPAAALRELLGVADGDFLSADEVTAVLAEPLCAPAAAAAATATAPAVPTPPPLARSVSQAMGESGQDFVTTARPCLERCDARTLRELKAVSAAWQRRAREVLCDAASAWRRQPIWSPSAEGRALAARLSGRCVVKRHGVLACMGRELDCGVDLPGHALAVVPLLEDSEWMVRRAAVQTLGKLEPAALAQHGAALAARLGDSGVFVQIEARFVMHKLEPAAGHMDAVAAKLEDSNEYVRRAAVETLGKLDLADLAQHQQALAKAAKEDKDYDVQIAARVVMHKLEPAAGHMDAVVAKLEHSYWGVRNAAVEALSKLDSAALAQHGAALVAKLEDPVSSVRRTAVETLGKLEPAALAPHGAAVVARLEDSDSGVREAAVQTLGELEPAALAQHGAALVAKLEDSPWIVGKAVVETLGKLEPTALTQHGAALAARLGDSDYRVRKAVMQTLGKLETAPLALHEQAIAKVAEEDSDSRVRSAAATVLAKLTSQ